MELRVGRKEEQQNSMYYTASGLLYITDLIWCDAFHWEASARAYVTNVLQSVSWEMKWMVVNYNGKTWRSKKWGL